MKLSKLSVIKIATTYIMALSRMAGHDYTEDQSAPPVEEVIKHCSEVIETESRIKKRSTSPSSTSALDQVRDQERVSFFPSQATVTR